MRLKISIDLMVGVFLGIGLACVFAVGTCFHLTAEVKLGEAANHRLRVQIHGMSERLEECIAFRQECAAFRQEFSCPDSAPNAFLTCVDGPFEDIFFEIRLSSIENGGVCEPD